jgi:hypothetical protein
MIQLFLSIIRAIDILVRSSIWPKESQSKKLIAKVELFFANERNAQLESKRSECDIEFANRSLNSLL